MAITCGFFDSQNGDRKYNAKTLGQFFDGLITNGVFASIGGALRVTPVNGEPKINVASGRAYINGHWLYNDDTIQLSIDPVLNQSNRTDVVVVQLSEELRKVDIIVKKGTTKIEQNNQIFELELATIAIDLNGTKTVSDSRASKKCGYVTGLIKQVDLSFLLPDLDQISSNIDKLSNIITQNYDKSLHGSGATIAAAGELKALLPDLNTATKATMYSITGVFQQALNIPPTTADSAFVVTLNAATSQSTKVCSTQLCATSDGLFYRSCWSVNGTEQWTEWVNLLNSDNTEIAEQIQQNTTALATKLTKPETEGTAGQVLQTNGDGTSVWADAMTEIENGTVTPEKTSFFTKSDIEYEIVEGKKISAFNSFLSCDDAFTLFIKIPDKTFAWISVTPSNTVVPYGSGTRLSGSLICDADKKALGAYGFTDNNRNLCVLRGDKVSDYDGAAYFATSYTLGTEFDIKIGGIGVCNNIEIPISNTELGTDFIVSGKNLISDTDTKVIYSSSNDRWSFQGSSSHNITNFFEIKNNTAYYHNGRYVYIELFDEHYNHVGSVGNHNSGDIIQKGYNFKYAYAYSTTSTGIPNDFWLADTDLSRKNKSANVVNPDYIDLSNIKRMQIKNWYNGKRVSFMGDSLTDNGTGGFYINYLNDYFGFANITKSAKGGTMVSGVTTAMGSAFWEDSRVNQLDIDSDVVFIMGGTNDANNNVSLGSPDISNCDTNTFYGAYHVLISKLIYKYYKLDTGYYADIDYSGVTQAETAKPVQIFLITPPYMLSSESQYKKTPAYCEAVIDIGKQLGCPVCDIRANSGVNIFAREYYKYDRNHTGTYDYVHVSPEAHEHWTKVIIGKMLEVEPIEMEV